MHIELKNLKFCFIQQILLTLRSSVINSIQRPMCLLPGCVPNRQLMHFLSTSWLLNSNSLFQISRIQRRLLLIIKSIQAKSACQRSFADSSCKNTNLINHQILTKQSENTGNLSNESTKKGQKMKNDPTNILDK